MKSNLNLSTSSLTPLSRAPDVNNRYSNFVGRVGAVGGGSLKQALSLNKFIIFSLTSRFKKTERKVDVF